MSPALLVPLAAVLWWAVGFLPWLLSGFHDEVRASDPALETGVGERLLAVPLITMHLTDLALGGVVGGLVAGLLGLLCVRRGRAAARTAVGATLGLVAALLVTHQQLAGAGDLLFAQEPKVVAALAAVLGVSTLLGWLLGVLATGRETVLAVAVAVLAGASTPLIATVLHATHTDVTLLAWVPNAPSWLGAVALAVALGVVGVSPLTRLLWWPVVFGAAYVVWPVLCGLSHLAPQLRPGISPGAVPALIGQAMHSAGHALLPSERLMLPWGMALGVGLMIAIVIELFQDSRLD